MSNKPGIPKMPAPGSCWVKGSGFGGVCCAHRVARHCNCGVVSRDTTSTTHAATSTPLKQEPRVSIVAAPGSVDRPSSITERGTSVNY